MKIIVGDGKVSRVVRRPHDVVLSHSEIELRDDVVSIVRALRRAEDQMMVTSAPITVVNTAALINLEYCEDHPEEAYAVNVCGALNLGDACDILGYKLVHVSSGCVFDGGTNNRSFVEDDPTSPACVYTRTKAEAEDRLLNMSCSIAPLIVRPRQLVSARSHATNMITKFMALPLDAEFITSQNSITSIEDFKLMLEHLVSKSCSGIYHCANRDTISPYEIAMRLKTIRPKFEPRPIAYDDYIKRLRVKRVNTLLDISKLEATGFVPRTASSAIDWCIENYRT